MNVLVAGATGYLGRFLCAEYARRGHHVALLQNSPPDGFRRGSAA
ncbi:NAD-dependent epimerase/dehydratase family protein [Limimaricola litoreus]|uniref:NAD-dependent epimerase/dehydratase family protein n=1 Tax=Limimaricola litoreus TaxID=2955316 RepID=A0A9X2FN07_9RHOB|nr:NAD-dependent epimerase/dehydratase family protein [Limimaricola litoreus]MCP1167696.1 NAD-dependent epimerase/dehydratase family protein [Limimaricola litoreus]